MKKVMTIALIAAIGLSFGCASTQQPDQSDAEYLAYEAGFIVGDIHIINKGLANEDVKEVLDTIFAFVNADPNNTGDILDAFVLREITKLYPDEADQAKRDTMYAIYHIAKSRLRRQLDLNPDMSTLSVLTSFRKGIIDSTGILLSPIDTGDDPGLILQEMETY